MSQLAYKVVDDLTARCAWLYLIVGVLLLALGFSLGIGWKGAEKDEEIKALYIIIGGLKAEPAYKVRPELRPPTQKPPAVTLI